MQLLEAAALALFCTASVPTRPSSITIPISLALRLLAAHLTPLTRCTRGLVERVVFSGSPKQTRPRVHHCCNDPPLALPRAHFKAHELRCMCPAAVVVHPPPSATLGRDSDHQIPNAANEHQSAHTVAHSTKADTRAATILPAAI